VLRVQWVQGKTALLLVDNKHVFENRKCSEMLWTATVKANCVRKRDFVLLRAGQRSELALAAVGKRGCPKKLTRSTSAAGVENRGRAPCDEGWESSRVVPGPSGLAEARVGRTLRDRRAQAQRVNE